MQDHASWHYNDPYNLTEIIPPRVHTVDNPGYYVKWKLFRTPVREGARTQWMGAQSWGKGAWISKAGTRSVSWTQIRGVEGRDRMRRRQEVKEDDSSTASGCQHAQSKWCALLRRNKWTRQRCVYILYSYGIYCFRKINHCGASTICIHPLM